MAVRAAFWSRSRDKNFHSESCVRQRMDGCLESQKSKVKSQEESLSSFVVCVAHGGSCTFSRTSGSGVVQQKM
jgi:hypothetical protein